MASIAQALVTAGGAAYSANQSSKAARALTKKGPAKQSILQADESSAKQSLLQEEQRKRGIRSTVLAGGEQENTLLGGG